MHFIELENKSSHFPTSSCQLDYMSFPETELSSLFPSVPCFFHHSLKLLTGFQIREGRENELRKSSGIKPKVGEFWVGILR
ncbi:hypothetical protein Peur_028872 [Populus x canadensis]